MTEQKESLQQKIEALRQQQVGLSAGDVFNFGSTALVSGLVLSDLAERFQSYATIDGRAKLVSMIINAKENGNLRESLVNMVGKGELNDKITNVLSGAIDADSFTNLTRIIGNGCSKPYNNAFLNHLDEHFPGKVLGAVVVAGVLIGGAVVAHSKAQRNELMEAQIAAMLEHSNATIPSTRITEARMMTDLRTDIEKLDMEPSGKSR